MNSSTIFWIGSWANNSEKKERTIGNLRLLKGAGFSVGLVTHYPDVSWIPSGLVDYLLLEKTNEIPNSYSDLFSSGFSSLTRSCWKKEHHFENYTFEKRLAIAPHTFPILRAISQSVEISLNAGFELFAYAEEDFVVTRKFLQFVKSQSNESFDFSGFESFTTTGGINPCFFLAKPSFLHRFLKTELLRSSKDFFLNFPNMITEDVLYNISKKSANSKILDKNEICNLLGEYGKGWDISHIGFSWAKEADENCLNTLCTNFPFLRKNQDNSYSISFLIRQELIPEHVYFDSEIILHKKGKSERIFGVQENLYIDFWKAWFEFYNIHPEIDSWLEVNLKTKSSRAEVTNNFILPLDKDNLDSYSNIFSLIKNQ